MATGGQPIDLSMSPEQLQKIRLVMGAKPTVVAMYFDRPYVVPELAKEAAALAAGRGVCLGLRGLRGGERALQVRGANVLVEAPGRHHCSARCKVNIWPWQGSIKRSAP